MTRITQSLLALSYNDLEVFRESQRLAIEVHQQSLQFPKFELYEEGSQLRRSSKSICAMIVEGYGRRRYKADYIKYLVYALAECDETILHLDFVFKTRSLLDEQGYNALRSQYQTLAKQLTTFLKWVEANWNPGK